MVFPVVMYVCESWTVKKAEHRRIDAFDLWCWESLGLQGDPTSPFWRRSALGFLWIIWYLLWTWLPWWLRLKRICLQLGRPGFEPWVGKISWRRERLPTSVFLPGEFRGQRSLAGYSPWGRKESTWLSNFHTHIHDPGRASQVVLVVKNHPDNAGDVRDAGSIPGLRRSPGGGPGNAFQYSCLENPMDRGAWRATVHRVAKSRTRLKQLGMQTHTNQEICWEI